ncbi:MAG TPA: type III pantothenate kinase [Ruminococcaceae bacterium]|nr:type III pantothenate kinase [Oscillospiraceae bacterium]
MILTIDVGNTNTTFGCFDEGGALVFESRISTDIYRMQDQYAVSLADILRLYDIDRESVSGAVLSSVVPPVTAQIKPAVEKICKCRVMTVGPGLKTGLNIKIDEPASLGADIAAVAVGAKEYYALPAIVVDLGTATKVLAVDKTGAFIGGIIAPGLKISAEALSAKTAALPLIGVSGEPLKRVIGANTIDCMRSGLLYGHAFMLDGMIESFEKEIGEKCTVVATGGFSTVIEPLCKTDFILDENLILKGLLAIYRKNE